MSDWLKGPDLAEWLDENFPDTMSAARKANKSTRHDGYDRELGALGRAKDRWKHGARASVFDVDRHLTPRGIHLSMLPDELFTDEPPARGGHRKMVAA